MGMKTTPIDNGFLLISASDARKLGNGLPGPGRERLVAHDGQHYWLARTLHQGQQHWSIRATKWRLVNGQATLAA